MEKLALNEEKTKRIVLIIVVGLLFALMASLLIYINGVTLNVFSEAARKETIRGKAEIFRVTASNTQGDSKPEYVFDGKMETSWATKGKSQTLVIELKEEITIDYANIAAFRNDNRKPDFKIEVSTDNKNWRRVTSGSIPSTKREFHKFTASNTQTKSVRITVNGSNSDTVTNIMELEIYYENRVEIKANSTPVITTSPTTTTVTSTTAPTQSGTQYPAQILNLTNWKETLPIGPSENPTEIKQPALATFKSDPWFIVSPGGQGVRFRAPVSGVTTDGSTYPRSELREMTNNGQSNASWSTSSGTHTMTIDQAITALPQGKKHVVAGQIHDSKDDVIVIRLEEKKLFVDIGGDDGATLTSNYVLGTRFTVKFEVKDGKTSIYYNGSSTPAETITKPYSGAYFKAGAYTQSNCSTEKSNGNAPCSNTNYGEVVIYDLKVTH
jgi:hypothetical protein